MRRITLYICLKAQCRLAAPTTIPGVLRVRKPYNFPTDLYPLYHKDVNLKVTPRHSLQR